MTPAGERTPDTGQAEEAYYRELWASDRWGAGAPNSDEAARAGRIVELIDSQVLPALGGKRLRILDLGCGRGWLTAVLASRGEVLGIDPTPAGVARAQELFPELRFECSGTRELLASRGPGQFDLVVSSEVIEHVPEADQAGFLRDIHALLAEDGFAILTTPRGELREAWERAQTELQPVEDWLTGPRLQALCEGAGFAVRRASRVFVPVELETAAYRLLNGRVLRAIMARWPSFPLARALRWFCSIYQVVLLQRVTGQRHV